MTLHAFPKNRVKLDLLPEYDQAKRMRMRTKKLSAVNIHLKLSITPAVC